jgi:hypothetical protein
MTMTDPVPLTMTDPVPPRQASRSTAIWALVLAILPLVLTWVAAVVLAVVTLTRPKDGRDHGTGFAVAALVVVAGWLAASFVAFVVVVAMSDTGASSTAGDEVEATEISVGDCVPKALADDPNMETIDLVPCGQPHAEEVYAEFDLPRGDYPGDAAITEAAEEGCVTRFDTFIGMPFDDSELAIYFLHPLEESWPQDREVTCLVSAPEPTTGTLEGAAR